MIKKLLGAIFLFSLLSFPFPPRSALANEPDPPFPLEREIRKDYGNLSCDLVCPPGKFLCSDEEKIPDCKPVGRSFDGTLSLPDEIKMPVLREVADYLEGAFYNEEKLQKLKAAGAGIPELHGPLDKLLPFKVQEEYRRQFIRRIQSKEFGENYDYQIPVYKDSPEEEICEKTVEGKRPDWIRDPQKQGEECRLSLLKLPSPPSEDAPDEDLKNWQKENLPGELWLKVPMAARGNVTVNGYFNFTGVSCQVSNGNLTLCDLAEEKDLGELRSELERIKETGEKPNQEKYHYRLEVPQLVRLREVSKILWERLTSGGLQQSYRQDFLYEKTGLRPDPNDDTLSLQGKTAHLTVSGDLSRPQENAYLAAKVKGDYILPYLADSYHFLSGENGLLTNFNSALLPSFSKGNKFLPEEAIMFEEDKRNWWEKLLDDLLSLIKNFPLIDSIWGGKNFMIKILTPFQLVKP